MTDLKIDAAAFSARLRADVLLIPTPIVKRRPLLNALPGLPPAVARRLAELHAAYHGRAEAGAIDDHLLERGAPIRRIALVSLGKSQRPTAEDIRAAAAAAARWCTQNRLEHALVAADPLQRYGGRAAAALWSEASVMAAYRFDRLRGRDADSDAARLGRLTVAAAAAPARPLRDAIASSAVLAECVNLARTVGHEPPNVINPVTLARRAQQEARRVGLRCTIVDHRRMAALKMGAFLAVGAGSAAPPRLIVLEHRGRRPDAPPVALVGKAVTLDTGGYSIKPWESIPDMKYDKCGGMAVLGAMVAAARLKIPQRVVGLIAAAENMIDERAYRPGDILTAMNGRTIEVISTDAEGRLVLADSLCYVQRFYKPRTIIDLATLTGACAVALGNQCAGLFTHRDDLADALTRSGQATGDRVWRLPLWPEYRRQIRGTDADIKNSGGRYGGAITAAVFLNDFVESSVPWAHLDIAGVSHIDKDTPICPAGATGFGVRLLLHYLTNRG